MIENEHIPFEPGDRVTLGTPTGHEHGTVVHLVSLWPENRPAAVVDIGDHEEVVPLANLFAEASNS